MAKSEQGKYNKGLVILPMLCDVLINTIEFDHISTLLLFSLLQS